MKAVFPVSPLALALAVTLCGCAQVNTVVPGWLASSAPALAIVNGVLYEGKATMEIDRTGSVQLASTQNPQQLCSGSFRYTATSTGALLLSCGGTETVMPFTALDALRVYGYGGTEKNPASFTFGFSASSAAAYLRVPAGQQLLAGPMGPRLQSIAMPAPPSPSASAPL